MLVNFSLTFKTLQNSYYTAKRRTKKNRNKPTARKITYNNYKKIV